MAGQACSGWPVSLMRQSHDRHTPRAWCPGLAATLNHSAQRMSTGAGPLAGMLLVEPFPAGYMCLMTCHPTCWLAFRSRVCRAGWPWTGQTRKDRPQLRLG